MIKSWYPKWEELVSFSDLLKAAVSNSSSTIPGALSQWLGELCLLYDLPFQYLVVNEQLLKDNNIRFFYLNPNWIIELMDGACSLGRNTSIDLEHDRALIEEVYNQALKECKNIRPMLQGKPKEEIMEQVGLATGFLLRSPLVKGWRGLEFKAYDENNQELRALRLETLSSEVLLGLYQGDIKRLDIAQPPESFHFGFDKLEGQYKKRVRKFETGELLDEYIEVVIKNQQHRVVDVQGTIKNMSSHFKKTFTSAEFALQMIKNPYIGRIDVQNKNE